jgi:hypothetical protein
MGREMGTVNMNFRVLQSWNKRTGDNMWENGCLVPRYEEYEWRDYRRDNIDGDGRSRYQLWKNDRYTGESFDPNTMGADKQRMIEAAWAAEKRAAERAATKGGWGGQQDVRMLLEELREVNAVNFRGV